MLSAAPGFFVDHEDGEGLGNDVYLRGFDLDSGSGLEMKVGEIPINVPLHIRGQGYADANFLIPEVVRSVHVLEGPYDPRQGDSAIVGSARFDLGVAERGYQLKATYGSFDQARLVGIAAPREENDDTFAAVALRETQGFGQDRASRSGSINAQYGFDLGEHDHLRLLATGYAASAALPGVVRQPDVDAGRIGFDDSYRYFNSYYPRGCSSLSCAQAAQGVDSARAIVAAELEHRTGRRRALRCRALADVDDLPLAPELHGGTRQLEPAAVPREPRRPLAALERRDRRRDSRHDSTRHLCKSPTSSTSSSSPASRFAWATPTRAKTSSTQLPREPWDHRDGFGLETEDVAGYLDVDARFWRTLRVSGGVRADLLDVAIHDDLAGASAGMPAAVPSGSSTQVTGVAPGPRVAIAYEGARELVPGRVGG